MATKTILVDDLDGGEAYKSVAFAFDGTSYEVDLSREHLESLRNGLQPWIQVARVMSRPKRRTSGGASNKEIRAWARLHGWPDMGNTGKIPKDVLDAYERAE